MKRLHYIFMVMVMAIFSFWSINSFAALDINLALKQIHQVSPAQITTLKQKANQGDAKAQYQLGMDYFYGMINPEGMVKDPDAFYKQSAYWLKKAANNGSADAAYQLGLSYLNAYGLAYNSQEGVKWLKIAAKRGNKKAYYQLALVYRDGVQGIKKDPALAQKYIQAGVSYKDYSAMTFMLTEPGMRKRMGNYEYNKMIVHTNIMIKQLAAAGDIRAMYAEAFDLEANGFERDAVLLLVKASKLGDSHSQFTLGMQYIIIGNQRHNVKQIEMGCSWVYQSAIRHVSKAARFMARLYSDKNKFVKKDPIKAKQWLERAHRFDMISAKLNDPEAQLRVSKDFALGQGVKADDKQALYWLQASAKLNNRVAQKLKKYLFSHPKKRYRVRSAINSFLKS